MWAALSIWKIAKKVRIQIPDCSRFSKTISQSKLQLLPRLKLTWVKAWQVRYNDREYNFYRPRSSTRIRALVFILSQVNFWPRVKPRSLWEAPLSSLINFKWLWYNALAITFNQSVFLLDIQVPSCLADGKQIPFFTVQRSVRTYPPITHKNLEIILFARWWK